MVIFGPLPQPTAGLLAPGPGPDPTQALVDSLAALLGSNAFVLRSGPNVWEERLATLPPAEREEWLRYLENTQARLIGQTIPSKIMAQPDTVELYTNYDPNPLKTLLHEAGHVAHHRNVIPAGVLDSLIQQMPKFVAATPQDFHYSRSESEYVAEGFSRAWDLLRRTHGNPSKKDIAKADRSYPGLMSFINWLRQQQPFAPSGS